MTTSSKPKKAASSLRQLVCTIDKGSCRRGCWKHPHNLQHGFGSFAHSQKHLGRGGIHPVWVPRRLAVRRLPSCRLGETGTSQDKGIHATFSLGELPLACLEVHRSRARQFHEEHGWGGTCQNNTTNQPRDGPGRFESRTSLPSKPVQLVGL